MCDQEHLDPFPPIVRRALEAEGATYLEQMAWGLLLQGATPAEAAEHVGMIAEAERCGHFCGGRE